MKSGEAAAILIILGFLSGAGGLFVGGIFNYLSYFGVSWLIAGVVYGLAGRKVTDAGFLAALSFGGAGALIWLFIAWKRDQNEGAPATSLKGAF